MKKILYIFFLLVSAAAWSQQVINSAGSHRVDNATGISITDNVGEPFIITAGPVNNIMITEGYLQPFIVSPGFSVTLFKNDVTCLDKNDGNVSLTISTVYPRNKYTVVYNWGPAGICPGNNCASIDSLAPGTYSVDVRITYTTTAGLVKLDSSLQSVIINGAYEPCRIKIYTGITPDGDGKNETWTIGNIEQFPKNRVTIFNRWGAEIFSVRGYTNTDITKSWPTQEERDKLPASTYFYVIELGDGTRPIKGWVELIKN